MFHNSLYANWPLPLKDDENTVAIYNLDGNLKGKGSGDAKLLGEARFAEGKIGKGMESDGKTSALQIFPEGIINPTGETIP